MGVSSESNAFRSISLTQQTEKNIVETSSDQGAFTGNATIPRKKKAKKRTAGIFYLK